MLVDGLKVGTSFSDVEGDSSPVIVVPPQSQTVFTGDTVVFGVQAGGTPPLWYQWQFYGTNLLGQTNASLALFNVTTNQAGPYSVTITNDYGATNSPTATLTVNPAPAAGSSISLVTYNVKGFNAVDWSTNSAQVQAIARQMQYLNPDFITFQEIPFPLRYEMTNFVRAFLPGYKVAISSGTDGSLCSAIVSRFTITRSNSWLDSADLKPFGYTNTSTSLADNYTRDLFEVQITVPGFPRPLHIFTTHLKATSSSANYAEDAAKRAAEAAAITNFFATNLFVLYPYDPYVLTGDLNDNDTNTVAIQRLVSPPSGLRLTNPANPVTGSINTYYSTTNAANPSSRLDYIMPGGLLYSNIAGSQVFRTDRLTPLPPNLNSNDCRVASDHLPVLMVFNNPYTKPFLITSITRGNPNVTLQWQSVFGQPYRVEVSSNLTTWSALATNLTATGGNYTYSTNVTGDTRYFRIYRVP